MLDRFESLRGPALKLTTLLLLTGLVTTAMAQDDGCDTGQCSDHR